MKVIKSEESYVQFDNGLEIIGDGDVDCCAYNYLDFEQFPVGTEFKNMTAKQFVKAAKVKEDGFILKDVQQTPKWCQARSSQNGYYSSMTTLSVKYKGETIEIANLYGDMSEDY